MRTITLEFLRHGTAHNQLLSPLTPYLALCENHAAVTIHVPFEHNQLLHRLRALSYSINNESRVFQLKDIAKVLGDLLSGIPGLTAESNKANNEDTLTHLRLIISASELALLPFEISLSPDGLPGTGQNLLLQPQMPICLTREIRRVAGETINWTRKPKILFVAAAPPEVDPIPLDAHLLILRRLISPWVRYFDEDNSEMRRRRIAEHFHFIPNASIQAIEDACATGQFTHIHILAHGLEVPENYDKRFALALHNHFDPNQTEYINGSRLATALRASQRPDNQSLSSPLVVTLASCNSGNVGTVAGAGSSIAHALHESGIPMVVAGQFPLSVKGSIRILECLYEGLLWGTEPRALLYDLRRRLFSQYQDNHDWASLISYFSLPWDLDGQLQQFKIDQAMGSINASFNYADEVTRRLFTKTKSKFTEESKQISKVENKELVETAKRKIEESKKRLKKLVHLIPAKEADIKVKLASTEKRQAEILFAATNKSDVLLDGKTKQQYKIDHIELLKSAREHYWEAFLLDRSKAGSLVQYLSLTLILQELKPDNSSEIGQDRNMASDKFILEKNPEAIWSLAHLLSLQDINSKDSEIRLWGYGNLIEIYLLSLIMPRENISFVSFVVPGENMEPYGVYQEIAKYADLLIDGAGRKSFQVYSTRRQLIRYIEWFSDISDIKKLDEPAQEVFKKFSDDVEESWEYD